MAKAQHALNAEVTRVEKYLLFTTRPKLLEKAEQELLA